MFKEIAEINRFCEKNNVNATQKNKAIQMAFAAKVAYGLDLPTSELEDSSEMGLSNLYNLSCEIKAKEEVSVFNEKLAINVPETLELIKAIWCARVRVAFRPNLINPCRLLESVKFNSTPKALCDLDEVTEKAVDFFRKVFD